MKPWVNKATALLFASLQPPKHELNELDWKAALSPDKKRLAEHISAFANHPGGGFFAIGVSNAGDAVGVLDVDGPLNQITNIGRDALEPSVAVDHAVETVDGARILFVHVPEATVKPVHIRGKDLQHSFIRSGGTTRVASRQELGQMMLTSRTPQWEELRASVLLPPQGVLELIEPALLLTMLERPAPSDAESRHAWLEDEKFIESVSGGSYITNLGAIAAGKDLTQFPSISRKAVRVIVYAGRNKAKAVQEIEGKRGYAIAFQSLLRFVNGLLPQSEVIQDALRVKKTVYPEIALREIIANALIHQDFSITGAGPLVEIFEDRVEITNPGALLPSKTLDRLIGTQPESRNELLARAFRRYKICEERGSGLLKAGLAVEMHGLPPIRFQALPGFFKVTLFAPKTFAQLTPAERLEACYQHSLLQWLSDKRLTNTSLRERLKMPERQRSMVSVLIQQAVENQLIKPSDPGNTSRKFAEYVPIWA